MVEGLEERLEVLGCLPSVMDYKELLDMVERRFRITRDQARDRYGRYTYPQWKTLLKENI